MFIEKFAFKTRKGVLYVDFKLTLNTIISNAMKTLLR